MWWLWWWTDGGIRLGSKCLYLINSPNSQRSKCGIRAPIQSIWYKFSSIAFTLTDPSRSHLPVAWSAPYPTPPPPNHHLPIQHHHPSPLPWLHQRPRHAPLASIWIQSIALAMIMIIIVVKTKTDNHDRRPTFINFSCLLREAPM